MLEAHSRPLTPVEKVAILVFLMLVLACRFSSMVYRQSFESLGFWDGVWQAYGVLYIGSLTIGILQPNRMFLLLALVLSVTNTLAAAVHLVSFAILMAGVRPETLQQSVVTGWIRTGDLFILSAEYHILAVVVSFLSVFAVYLLLYREQKSIIPSEVYVRREKTIRRGAGMQTPMRRRSVAAERDSRRDSRREHVRVRSSSTGRFRPMRRRSPPPDYIPPAPLLPPPYPPKNEEETRRPNRERERQRGDEC